MSVLRSIANVLREHGWETWSPTQMFDDHYRWAMLVVVDGDGEKLGDHDIDITLEMCESEQHGDDPGGVTFRLDIVEVGGRILGGCSPYNYTEKCWGARNDPGAVEVRFSILEQLEFEEIVRLIEQRTQRMTAKN